MNSTSIFAYNEDFFEAKIPQNYFDVIVTSIPYNIGMNYDIFNDRMPRKDYLEWVRRFTAKVRRSLKDTGSFFLNIRGKPSDLDVPFDVRSVVKESFVHQNTVWWIHSITIDDVSKGHYKPINSDYYLNDLIEPVFHFTKTGKVPIQRKIPGIGVPYMDKSNIQRWKEGKDDQRCRGNVVLVPYRTIQNKSVGACPASFPVELPEYMIRLHGARRGLKVLDPCAGDLNSAKACYRISGVESWNYEISPSYYRKGVEHFYEFCREKDLHPS